MIIQMTIVIMPSYARHNISDLYTWHYFRANEQWHFNYLVKSWIPKHQIIKFLRNHFISAWVLPIKNQSYGPIIHISKCIDSL